MASILCVRDLRKSYGEHEVVKGVSFSIEAGKCFGLLGPNGAGKTTTLRLCLGLINPDGGKIELTGEPVPARARQARMRVGVVPQTDNLDPDFTAAENLLVYGRYFGLRDLDIRSRIPPLLEFAGLTGRGESRIQTLSGGMKRRLTLARALINDPDILFMDEPTTGLGLSTSWLSLWALAVIPLVGLCFGALALVITSLAPSYDFFMYYFTLVMTPMTMLCGVFFPTERLPEAFQIAANFLPLTHATLLVRPLLLGSAPQDVALDVTVLAIYAAAGFALALTLFRRRLAR